jgi:hypothetical protein
MAVSQGFHALVLRAFGQSKRDSGGDAMKVRVSPNYCRADSAIKNDSSAILRSG